MKMKVNIVGMRHVGITADKIQNIATNTISFTKEPTNPHDKFAIQCWAGNKRVGYIEASKSEKLSKMLDQIKEYSAKILDYDEYKINIIISFDSPREPEKFEKIPDGDAAGIYRIRFKYRGEYYSYIGQSVNINKRLQAHYSELQNSDHHNEILQSAWLIDNKSFEHSIVERASNVLNGLDRQLFLFQRELHYIATTTPTANRIDADLVLTKESRDELGKLVRQIKLKLRDGKRVYETKKEEVGKLIINLGIMKEERFSDGWQRGGKPQKYLTVSPSNILTWLHKNKYSVFDYRPQVNYDHPRFNELKSQLESLQSQIAILDLKRKFVDDFLGGFCRRSKYETCNILELGNFLKIVDQYKE